MSEKENQVLKEARERLRICIDDDKVNRDLALDDLRFIAEENYQWPEYIRKEREAPDNRRPCITINKMPAFIDQVVGDQRMNRPSIKVIPVDSKADVKVAQILDGWIKHVQVISKADIAIDHGFEHAVSCGYGAIRVVTDYVSDDSFDQEAFIRKVDNALSVYWGPHSEYDCSDAMYCFIVGEMTREEFKQEYGVNPVAFTEGASNYVEGWSTKDKVRVVEYFVKEPVKRTIYLLNSGMVVEKLQEGMQVKRKREVKGFKIMWYLLSGDTVLDKREWVGRKYIPVIPIWGREVNIGGKWTVRSLIRNAKDAQRMYNYWASCDTEYIALQPKIPYMITPDQIKGHEQMWNNLNNKNYTYLLCNGDNKAPGWPQRQPPPQASTAIIEARNAADQEMRDTIGLQKASMGMQSNERSGAAIRERKREGDVGTFAFIDNLSRSLEQVGRVLIDIAPRVLDTERIIRMGLEDGSFKFEAVNVEDASGTILNDLSVGTYDVVVTVGPSFTTQRSEARQSMQEFIQYYPQAAPFIGDLYAKAMDWVGAADFGERLEFLLPPEVRAVKEAKEAENGGTDRPPTTPPPQPPPPDPLVVLKVKQAEASLQEAQIKIEQEKVVLEGLKLKNELMVTQAKEDVKKLLSEIDEEENAGEEKNA